MLVHEIIKNGRVEDTAIVDEGRIFTYADFAQETKNFAELAINSSAEKIFEYVNYRKNLR